MSVSCNDNSNNPLDEILSQNDSLLRKFADQPDKYELQIIYTQINRDNANVPDFTDFNYQLDSSVYFYPASTVKIPVAFLALEKLNEIKKQGFQIDKFTPLKIDSVRESQTSVKKYVTNESGYANIAHYIKKIFLVSDNDAYNRLFEFLGRDFINEKFKEKRITPGRITHRLSSFNVDNKYSNPIIFSDDSILYQQEEIISQTEYLPLKLKNTLKGKGYINKDHELVNKPMDFSQKNYLQLWINSRIFPIDCRYPIKGLI
ncbi:MAG: serine hydrolase [Bacteroidota bacterium]